MKLRLFDHNYFDCIYRFFGCGASRVAPERSPSLDLDLTGNELTAYRDYLDKLRKEPNSEILISTARRFMKQTRQFLPLNISSLIFLNKLSKKDTKSYAKLLALIAARGPDIFLKAHHLDTVIEIFERQRCLPPNASQEIDIFAEQLDIGKVVQQLRLKHFPDIDMQSKEEHLLHHTLKHAAEIKVRTVTVIDRLDVLSDSDSSHRFLRHLTKFAIEGHDLKQRNSGDCPTVELATAVKLEEWLIKALELDKYPLAKRQLIQDYIRLTLHRIIVLGTTMIFSYKSTLDLSELFYWIEQVAQEAGMETCHKTNHDLCVALDVIALLTGVCDKTPSALYDVVKQQNADPHTNSLVRLKSVYSDLILDRFMSDTKSDTKIFKPYFSIASPEENAQAFMMGLVPHLCMRAELAAAKLKAPLASESDKALAKKAVRFIDFICHFQSKFSSAEPAAQPAILEIFKRDFINERMDHYVDELFFSMLLGEINFSKSQVQSLTFVRDRLMDLGYLKPNETDTFINPNAPCIDAMNIEALGEFYDKRLNADERMRLSQELVLNVIMQAGASYLCRPPSQPTSPANHERTLSASFSSKK